MTPSYYKVICVPQPSEAIDPPHEQYDVLVASLVHDGKQERVVGLESHRYTATAHGDARARPCHGTGLGHLDDRSVNGTGDVDVFG